MSTWEYCAVIGIDRVTPGRHLHPLYPAIWYFTKEGVQVVELKGNEAKEVAQTIARLGEEGWEMVGCEPLAVYFKRPKA